LVDSNSMTIFQSVTKLPFVEKYRPNDLNDIISHEEIITTSKHCISG